MIKVFESFEFSEVGRVRSLLDAAGIPTFLRNEFSSSVMGEMPFVEVFPQLYVLRDDDVVRARAILQQDALETRDEEPWACPVCKTGIEPQFTQCWYCGSGPGG